jgi:dTDP-4-dehydrorhamnose reductase
MTRRLLILGGSGTLGGPLSLRAEQQGWEVAATYLNRPDRIRAGTPVALDLRDKAALVALLRDFQPEAIIHAAVTERSGFGFENTIRIAARHVARVASETGTRLIALSTDLVFDGTEPLYTETTPPRPSANSVYGHAKADAEREILATCPAALVVRTSLIYDFDRENAQVAWMLRAIERGETVALYTDQMRCPIWAFNLADALLELADTNAAGLLNVVGPESISRHTLGTALLAALGYDPARHVTPAQAPDTQPKALPLSIVLAQTLLKRTSLLTVDQAREARRA